MSRQTAGRGPNAAHQVISVPTPALHTIWYLVAPAGHMRPTKSFMCPLLHNTLDGTPWPPRATCGPPCHLSAYSFFTHYMVPCGPRGPHAARLVLLYLSMSLLLLYTLEPSGPHGPYTAHLVFYVPTTALHSGWYPVAPAGHMRPAAVKVWPGVK